MTRYDARIKKLEKLKNESDDSPVIFFAGKYIFAKNGQKAETLTMPENTKVLIIDDM
jgi:hypothetical protein